MTHKLLARQLGRIFGDASPMAGASPEVRAAFDALMKAVDGAYQAADEDRRLLERSLELTSQELVQRNRDLRRQLDELEAAERTARASTSTLRGVFTSVPLGLALVDEASDGAPRVVVQNASAPDIAELMAEPRVRALCREVLAEGRTGRIEHERQTEVGAIREVVIVAPVADVPGRLSIVTEDVSERHVMEARLRIADRMASMGTVAAGVAHEINNPLAYVIGNLTFLAERVEVMAGDDPELRDAFRDIQDGARRIQRIVRDLQTFTRRSDGAAEAVDIGALLDSCASIAGNEIRHRARLVRVYDVTELVYGDAGRLGQVFLNLLVNAAQAIPEGAVDRNEIRVVTRIEGADWLVVEIHDSGVGVPESIRERIFEPFFTTKPIGVGTGLGLSICANIVRDLGGHLTLVSELGRGSVFSVRLPRHRAMPTGRPALAPVTEPARARVLVVDDEPAVARLIARVLRGHDVTIAKSASEALERLLVDVTAFDVVLCDLMMPDMTGIDLYKALLELAPGLAEAMVFMTGGAFSASTREFVAAMGERCLDKPIDVAALRRAVGGALGRAAGNRNAAPAV